MRVLSAVKGALVSGGARPRRVRFGLYHGLIMELDLLTDTQVYLGLWERETYPWIRLAVSRCAWAIDVGAGRGELCLEILRNSQARRVYAFEPQEAEVSKLKGNLELNELANDPRLVLSTKFVGTADQEDFVPLDSLAIKGLGHGFLKVDVDGAEMDVLTSAGRILEQLPVDVLVETHSARLEQDCLQFLSARRFTCAVVENAPWRTILPEHRPIAHNRWLWATNS